jgi:NhaP-type Na+/H+ or K+/H+ antiporter/mannitol/fructose-specific phosphotransferase system IIA component (Ntr-type)
MKIDFLLASVSGPYEGHSYYIVGMALFLGAVLQILSHRIHIPAIVPLLLAGILIGPEVLDIIDPGSLDPQLLMFIVSLCVAVILFEGGLGLNIEGFRQAPAVIRRLLSLGILVTWLATTLAVCCIFSLSISQALLAASLVIVTGPTVIQPILRRTRVQEKIHHILLWESVLADPIGVFIAILSLEWLLMDGQNLLGQSITQFASRFGLGLFLGFSGGLFLDFLLRHNRIRMEHVNMTALGTAIFLFGLSDYLLPESGLLTVTVAGFLVGYRNPPRLKQVSQFKQEMTELAVSVLFILLAANLKMEIFYKFLFQNFSGLLLVGILLLLIRPLSVFLCTIGRPLKLGEKLFLSWMAPRGIVAASMTSLFALSLRNRGDFETADFIEAFVYSVIAVSVVLQGLSSGLVSRLTGVQAPKRSGWILIGAHRFSREIALFLKNTLKVRVILIDTNIQEIKKAQALGLSAEVANATEKSIFDRIDMIGIGNLLALTNNHHLNKVLCQLFSEELPHENLWRWSPGHDDKDETQSDEGRPVFTDIHNPILLSQELDKHQTRIRNEIPKELENHEQVKVLLGAYPEQQLRFQPEEKNHSQLIGQLVLHRLDLTLVHLTRSEIIAHYSSKSRDLLLKEMIARLARLYPDIDQENIVNNLIEREESFSTALGNAVAVPHTYCASLDESICSIAQIPEGVDFKAHDGQKVHLVFLLTSPPGDPDHHLKILGEIASVASNAKLVESLINAPQPSDVINLLEDFDRERFR